jgi:hypothetical protein
MRKQPDNLTGPILQEARYLLVETYTPRIAR